MAITIRLETVIIDALEIDDHDALETVITIEANAHMTNSGVEVASKQLELLHELVPTATTVTLLVNPTNPTLADALLRDAQPAAGKLGLKLHVLHASTERRLL